MAEAREQINAKVTQPTKALLLHYCEEHHATQGEVVDAAIKAFLTPAEGGESIQLILDTLREHEVMLGKVLKFLQTITTHIEAAAAPPPPMAAYWGGLYNGKLEQPAAEEPVIEAPPQVSPPRPSRLAQTFSAVWRRR